MMDEHICMDCGCSGNKHLKLCKYNKKKEVILEGVQFRTNTDIAKRFMGNISGLPTSMIDPQIGDYVRIYHDSEYDIMMVVSERVWTMANGSNPQLTCYLVPPNRETTSEFTKRLKEMGWN